MATPDFAPTPRSTLLLVVSLYVALTAALTYPLSTRASDTVLADGPDMHLFLWTIAWDVHAFADRPLQVFDANIYYPRPRTLAYSENLLGSAVFAAPVVWLTGNYVLALNLVLLLSVVLCAVGAFVLARRLGCGLAAAIVSGVIFAFAPSRLTRISQAHLATIQWVPFSLAYLQAYFASGRGRDLRVALVFFGLQVLTTGHGAAFLVVGAACLVGYRVALGERLDIGRRLRDAGVPGIAVAMVIMAVEWQYHRVQSDEGLRRTLENWVVAPESFIASPTHLHQWMLSMAGYQREVNERASAYLFPGILPLLLACLGLWRPALTGIARGLGGLRFATAGVARGAHMRVAPVAPCKDPPTPAALRAGIPILYLVGGVAALVALVVAVNGPIRVGRGAHTLLSIRYPGRATLVALAAAAARLLLLRRAPFDPRASPAPVTSGARALGRRLRSAAHVARTIARAFAVGCLAAGPVEAPTPQPCGAPEWPRLCDTVGAWASVARQATLPAATLTTLLAVLLSIGPPFGIWPYVYWMPGFNFVRVPSRFMLLGVLGLAVVAGRGVDVVTARIAPLRRQWLALALGAALVVEFFAAPLVVEPFAVKPPAIDRWLDTLPKPFAVAEVPIPRPNDIGPWERAQTTYMLHSLAHFQPTVHGYSGIRPPFHDALYRALVSFPDAPSLDMLRAAGVRYVVVHPSRYAPGEWPNAEAQLDRWAAHLRLLHTESDGRVYELGPLVSEAPIR